MSKSNGADSFAARVGRRAAEIESSLLRLDAEAVRARAQAQALQEIRDEERQAFDAVPANWARRFARAGRQGVALEWPGCPVSPDLAVEPGPWSIDPAGVYFSDLDSGVRSFVCSPVLAIGADTYAVMAKGGAWTTVRAPRAGGREAIVAALLEAGVTLGTGVQRSGNHAGARPEVEGAVGYLSLWLGLGGAGEVGTSPLARLSALGPGSGFGSSEEKARLAGVLTRHPGAR